MPAFTLHDSAHTITNLVGLVATTDGGVAAMIEFTDFVDIGGGVFRETSGYRLTTFDEAADGGLFQLGSDFAPPGLAPSGAGSVDNAFLIELQDGGFAAYGSAGLLENPADQTLLVRQFDSEGVLAETIDLVRPGVGFGTLLTVGFGDGRRTGWVEQSGDTITFVDPVSGLPLPPGTPRPGTFLQEDIGFDGGHVVHRADMEFVTGTAQSFAVTENAGTPVYRPVVADDLFAVSGAALAAGNVLVQVSETTTSDFSTRFVLDLLRPDETTAPRRVVINRPGDIAQTALAEIEGVGFAVFTTFVRISTQVDAATSADLRLFDFDGDLIARLTLTEPLGIPVTVGNSLSVLDLRDGSNPDILRLLTAWTEVTPGVDLSNQLMGEVHVLNPALNNHGTFVNDFLRGFGRGDRLAGGGGADSIDGNGGADTLLGDDGADSLSGGSGTDRLEGGRGDDRLAGGSEADTLLGGVGADRLAGEDGADQLSGGDDDDTLSGGAGADRLNGDDENDLLLGAEGADTLIGGLGADGLSGGAGSDRLEGGIGEDSLQGNSGDDRLEGRTGRDRLEGGDGADFLLGGGQSDTLAGGAGADRFVFEVLGESGLGIALDRILDFAGDDGDRIDLSLLDANTQRAGNNAFIYIFEQEFTRRPGQLRIEIDTGTNDTLVLGDVNGDGVADLEIVLEGTRILLAADFVL